MISCAGSYNRKIGDMPEELCHAKEKDIYQIEVTSGNTCFGYGNIYEAKKEPSGYRTIRLIKMVHPDYMIDCIIYNINCKKV